MGVGRLVGSTTGGAWATGSGAAGSTTGEWEDEEFADSDVSASDVVMEYNPELQANDNGYGGEQRYCHMEDRIEYEDRCEHYTEETCYTQNKENCRGTATWRTGLSTKTGASTTPRRLATRRTRRTAGRCSTGTAPAPSLPRSTGSALMSTSLSAASRRPSTTRPSRRHTRCRSVLWSKNRSATLPST